MIQAKNDQREGGMGLFYDRGMVFDFDVRKCELAVTVTVTESAASANANAYLSHDFSSFLNVVL